MKERHTRPTPTHETAPVAADNAMREAIGAIAQSKPGLGEAFWQRIPVCGKAIAANYHRQRFDRLSHMVKTVLAARPEADVKAVWKNADTDYEIALELILIAKKEIGWPQPHFLPDDPLWIVYWAHRDGMDEAAAFEAIEDIFDFTFGDSEIPRNENESFGDFVKFVEEKVAQRYASS